MSGIQIIGLREFRAKVDGFARSLPSSIRRSSGEAADLIVKVSRARVPLGPGTGGHARESIRKVADGREVRVVEGGSGYPYMPWLDFGGTIRKGSKKPVKRAFFKQGRYIWNVHQTYGTRIKAIMDGALEGASHESGLDLD